MCGRANDALCWMNNPTHLTDDAVRVSTLLHVDPPLRVSGEARVKVVTSHLPIVKLCIPQIRAQRDAPEQPTQQ